MRICPVSAEFEQHIRALSRQTQELHQHRLPHIFYDGGAEQQRLLDLIFDVDVPPNALGFMALQQDALAGYVLIILDGGQENGGAVNALIADICTVTDFQRQGVARALLTHCAAEKERRGWESLHAQVWQGNAASHALFNAAGYLAERTDYRLGSPSVPPPPDATRLRQRWLILLCLAGAGALLVYALL